VSRPIIESSAKMYSRDFRSVAVIAAVVGFGASFKGSADCATRIEGRINSDERSDRTGKLRRGELLEASDVLAAQLPTFTPGERSHHPDRSAVEFVAPQQPKAHPC